MQSGRCNKLHTGVFQTQDRKVTSLETVCKETEEFISEVVSIDGEVAQLINERKENFIKSTIT